MTNAPIPHDCDPRIAKLYAYWDARRPAPDRLPGRSHIKPAQVVALLPNVFLCEVHRDPLRFRYRLVGTGVTSTMEREVTGGWMDEVHRTFAGSPAHADFVATAETGALSYYRGVPHFHVEKEHLAIERILLPLAEDGVHINMLLGLTLYRAAHLAA